MRKCDWCNAEIVADPFTRHFQEQTYMFCSNDCFNHHWKYCKKAVEYDGKFRHA